MLAGAPRVMAGLIPPGMYFNFLFDGATPAIRGFNLANGDFSNNIQITNMTRAWLIAGLGVVYLFAAPWASRAFVWLECAAARWLLAPTARARLGARVEELATTRAETVDAQAAELRRIERDLHDGAQARLVSVAINLGLAEELLSKDPQSLAELLAEARSSTLTALDDLRTVMRGIQPPVLAEIGRAHV